MSLGSNAGASSAASEIKQYILKMIEDLQISSSNQEPLGNKVAIDLLQNVVKKCNSIIEVADAGWY